MKKKLKSTIFGAIGVLGLVFAVMVMGSVLGGGSASSRVHTLARIEDLRIRAAGLRADTLELDMALTSYLRNGDDRAKERFDGLLESARARLGELTGLNQKELQRERVKTASTLMEQWAKEAAQPQIDARKRLSAVKVGSLVDPAKGDKLMKDLRGLLEEYVTAAGEEAKAALNAADSAFGRLNIVVIFLGLLGGAAAAGVAVHLLRTVVKPIEGILAWFDAMRAGKTFTLEITANNEIADVADAFLRVGEELKHARKETELLSTTPENSTLPVLELKADGSVVYANPAAKKLAESVSITTAELLPTETLKQLGEFAGKDHTIRREKALGESKYDFVVRSASDKETLFAVGFPKQAKKA